MARTVIFPDDSMRDPRPGESRWVNVYPNGKAVHYGFARYRRDDAVLLKSKIDPVIYRVKITRK